MTLALPADIGSRHDRQDILSHFTASVAERLCVYVRKCALCEWRPNTVELPVLLQELSDCSILYARHGSRTTIEPLAGFIASDTIRACKLCYFLDVEPIDGDPGHRQRLDWIGLYSRQVLNDHLGIDVIAYPFSVARLDGMFGLAIHCGNTFQLTLADLANRPWSSRRSG